MLLIDIPARVEGGQRKLMFCHDGCSSALNFLLFYNQKRGGGSTSMRKSPTTGGWCKT
jgi:hypothetical protein